MAKAVKRDRWLSVVEARAETRFKAFRPYHVKRNGQSRLGAYDMRHCSQSVAAFEVIERFFHAYRMRARGYFWSSNPARWVRA